MKNSICVLGSLNMDIVLKVERMVKSGETILAKGCDKIPGGKGANQAVAARRLGANVYMIGKVGNDDNGHKLVEALKDDDVNLEYLYTDEKEPTGTAIIPVDDEGNNSIIVVSGSNMAITSEEIKKSEKAIVNSKVLIAQFETPVERSIEAFKMAKENGVITILNPAPARKVPEELLKYTDIIAPNETEAYELTGIKVDSEDKIKEASKTFLDKGVKFVIITLGERGAALVSKDEFCIVPAHKVKAIDTTAAGDSFIGGVAIKLCDEESLNYEVLTKAITFANKVSSIVVQRKGAQTSIPTLEEVMKA
ncbi:ribokinase [Clostridium peptidivorans]|uniref:ribokinase n=1 Tax=Clostridium peptidivorans TaxID=100174 RepID=UPI000BE2DCE1|nr:ribokinase [Clostridium peptidivorans]